MIHDRDPKRHCTMLKIFKFREWFENRYGNLCKEHDFYYNHGEKWQGDKYLFKQMWKRKTFTDRTLAVLTFLTVQMPWVWFFYLKEKYER